MFNLFTWWTETAEKWGREFIGKAMPEGIGGWHLRSPAQSYAIAWDCKWTADSSGFDLTAGEKRKAKDYIGRIRDQWELQVFSEDLSVYALISNHFREGQLGPVAEACKEGNPNWTGQVAFIDAEAVLALYASWVTHYDELLQRIELLRRELTSLLLASARPFARITVDEVNELVERVLAAPAAPLH